MGNNNLNSKGKEKSDASDLIQKIDEFKEKSSIVVTNRISDEIMDIKDKVFTRDIFNKDL